MSAAIKLLEEIGESNSIKQHNSLIEMLSDLNIEQNRFNYGDIINSGLVCGLFPADDSDEDTDDSDEGTDDSDEGIDDDQQDED